MLKTTIFQPPYPRLTSGAESNRCREWMLNALEQLNPGSADLIVLPEYANCPGLETGEGIQASAERESFEEGLSAHATRLRSHIVFGTVTRKDGEYFCSAVLLNRTGERQCKYDKTHLTEYERDELGLTPGPGPTLTDIEGVRVAFAICFDIYFPEFFARLTSLEPDLIVFPSYQRSEAPDRIAYLTQCRAMDTGAWIVRSSYAMPDPAAGGHSLVVAPWGEVQLNAGSQSGVYSHDIDTDRKFVKPASHGSPPVEHRALIERNRRPGLNRFDPNPDPGFPRICAHRGLSTCCPENTLPAMGAALAVGAHEVEFDVRATRDGVPVILHDADLKRVAEADVRIGELTWDEARQIDMGATVSEAWRGVRMASFDEIAEHIGRRATMNIHIKECGDGYSVVEHVCRYIRRNDLLQTAYIAADSDILAYAQQHYPEIERACLAAQNEPMEMIETALKYECRRVQFFRKVSKEQIASARDVGLICNLFYSDDPDEARQFIASGIDVILTNRAHVVTL